MFVIFFLAVFAFACGCEQQDVNEYILIAFKNNDGAVDFTSSDLEMLPKCIVLN